MEDTVRLQVLEHPVQDNHSWTGQQLSVAPHEAYSWTVQQTVQQSSSSPHDAFSWTGKQSSAAIHNSAYDVHERHHHEVIPSTTKSTIALNLGEPLVKHSASHHSHSHAHSNDAASTSSLSARMIQLEKFFEARIQGEREERTLSEAALHSQFVAREERLVDQLQELRRPLLQVENGLDELRRELGDPPGLHVRMALTETKNRHQAMPKTDIAGETMHAISELKERLLVAEERLEDDDKFLTELRQGREVDEATFRGRIDAAMGEAFGAIDSTRMDLGRRLDALEARELDTARRSEDLLSSPDLAAELADLRRVVAGLGNEVRSLSEGLAEERRERCQGMEDLGQAMEDVSQAAAAGLRHATEHGQRELPGEKFTEMIDHLSKQTGDLLAQLREEVRADLKALEMKFRGDPTTPDSPNGGGPGSPGFGVLAPRFNALECDVKRTNHLLSNYLEVRRANPASASSSAGNEARKELALQETSTPLTSDNSVTSFTEGGDEVGPLPEEPHHKKNQRRCPQQLARNGSLSFECIHGLGTEDLNEVVEAVIREHSRSPRPRDRDSSLEVVPEANPGPESRSTSKRTTVVDAQSQAGKTDHLSGSQSSVRTLPGAAHIFAPEGAHSVTHQYKAVEQHTLYAGGTVSAAAPADQHTLLAGATTATASPSPHAAWTAMTAATGSPAPWSASIPVGWSSTVSPVEVVSSAASPWHQESVAGPQETKTSSFINIPVHVEAPKAHEAFRDVVHSSILHDATSTDFVSEERIIGGERVVVHRQRSAPEQSVCRETVSVNTKPASYVASSTVTEHGGLTRVTSAPPVVSGTSAVHVVTGASQMVTGASHSISGAAQLVAGAAQVVTSRTEPQAVTGTPTLAMGSPKPIVTTSRHASPAVVTASSPQVASSQVVTSSYNAGSYSAASYSAGAYNYEPVAMGEGSNSAPSFFRQTRSQEAAPFLLGATSSSPPAQHRSGTPVRVHPPTTTQTANASLEPYCFAPARRAPPPSYSPPAAVRVLAAGSRSPSEPPQPRTAVAAVGYPPPSQYSSSNNPASLPCALGPPPQLTPPSPTPLPPLTPPALQPLHQPEGRPGMQWRVLHAPEFPDVIVRETEEVGSRELRRHLPGEILTQRGQTVQLPTGLVRMPVVPDGWVTVHARHVGGPTFLEEVPMSGASPALNGRWFGAERSA